MSTEGDVFYVYVKRQFVSTVISADECLWTFLLGVLSCLGARCMIKAICIASCVTLICNRCPNELGSVKLRVHNEEWQIYKNYISAIVFWCHDLLVGCWTSFSWASSYHWDGRLMLRGLCLVLGTEADADKRDWRPWQRCRSEDRQEKTDSLWCHSGKWSQGLRLGSMFCLCFLFYVCLWRVDVVEDKPWFPFLATVNSVTFNCLYNVIVWNNRNLEELAHNKFWCHIC